MTQQKKKLKMMAQESVKLLGFWSQHRTLRVRLALEAKGIAYEYQDEDFIRSKSELLLKMNPIDETVPVLIHNDKPIINPIVILEYIDDNWTQAPKFLPHDDTLMKAKLRIWANFVSDQVVESMHPIALTQGEELEKFLKSYYKNLQIVEDGIKDLFGNGKPVIHNNNLNLLDLVIWSVLGPYKAFEEALDFSILDPLKYPLLHSRVSAINELEVTKKVMPDHSAMISFLKQFQQLMASKQHATS
ncbi:hypothetical protein M9H77_10131 [Catharanthus roseus]|uniref:Uncharacterized protein n=1 Tax=Catharanthus roseus TaxID=4058 RepID=A0ACC0C315_CATRO|nr:hypothetical protein M9H77_10131 [Catharanthus roseus]